MIPWKIYLNLFQALPVNLISIIYAEPIFYSPANLRWNRKCVKGTQRKFNDGNQKANFCRSLKASNSSPRLMTFSCNWWHFTMPSCLSYDVVTLLKRLFCILNAQERNFPSFCSMIKIDVVKPQRRKYKKKSFTMLKLPTIKLMS